MSIRVGRVGYSLEVATQDKWARPKDQQGESKCHGLGKEVLKDLPDVDSLHGSDHPEDEELTAAQILAACRAIQMKSHGQVNEFHQKHGGGK